MKHAHNSFALMSKLQTLSGLVIYLQGRPEGVAARLLELRHPGDFEQDVRVPPKQ